MRAIVIPFLIAIHIGVELLYLLFANNGYSSNASDVVYFIADPFCFFLVVSAVILNLIFAKLEWCDVQFLIIYALINLFRSLCYLLNSVYLMDRTYNLMVVLFGTILTTVIIIISGYRHGYFNND